MTDAIAVITIYIGIAALIFGAWWGYTLAIVTGKLERKMGKEYGKK